MNEFIERYESEIAGVLSGFDRVLFRGTLRSLYALPVMDRYLASKRVLYKHFGKHAEQVAAAVRRIRRRISPAVAGRPFRRPRCWDNRAQNLRKRSRCHRTTVSG